MPYGDPKILPIFGGRVNPSCKELVSLFSFFLKLVGTYAAQGALVILRQLFALVNVTADGTDKFLHADSPLFF